MKNKTIETRGSVSEFLKKIPEEYKRTDTEKLIRMMKRQSGFEPKIWGSAIIGFGSYHYKYDSGHEGDAPLVCFSPRKNALTIYLMGCIEGNTELMQKLGKYKASKGCIYIKKLNDVNIEILDELINNSIKYIKKKYPKK